MSRCVQTFDWYCISVYCIIRKLHYNFLNQSLYQLKSLSIQGSPTLFLEHYPGCNQCFLKFWGGLSKF